MWEIAQYVNAAGEDVFQKWLSALRDRQAKARIMARVSRLAGGGFGDCKALSEGVWELRVDCGPGYRVYYAQAGKRLLLLLCAGDKRRQAADIARAVTYWRDWQRRQV